MNDQTNINSYILAAFAVILAGLITLWAKTSNEKNKRITDLEKDVAGLKTLVAVTDTKVTPLWAKVQKQMSDELHHPHADHQEADDLIDKLENLEATPAETTRLKKLFHERANSKDPKITARERSIATIMPVIMDLVLEEADTVHQYSEVESVAAAPITKLKEVQKEEKGE